MSLAVPAAVQPLRRLRGPAVLAAVALVAAAIAFGVVASVRGSDAAEQRDAFKAYAASLEPIAVDAGRVLELNVKPGLDELEAQSPEADLATRAQGWGRELSAIEQRLGDLDTPAELATAKARFRQALAGYIAMTADIAETADNPRAQRRAVAADVRSRGTATDEIWDSGARLVQQRARALSLPPESWLPEG